MHYYNNIYAMLNMCMNNHILKEEAIWGQKREYFNVPICHIPLTAYISLSFVFLMLADKNVDDSQ